MEGMLNLTLEKAKSLVDEAIEERGKDFVYKRQPDMDCKYVHEGVVWDPEVEEYVDDDSVLEPGCLVGLALHKAGIPLDKMSAVEGRPAKDLLASLEQRGYVTFDIEAADFLDAVQKNQDSGYSWSEALSLVLADVDD